MDSNLKLENLKRVAMKYELAGGAILKLRKLERYDIVVIADDSSSMNSPAHDPSADNPFQAIPSRWEELKKRVMEIVEIATCLDQDGIDLYFLNRPPVYNVHDNDTAMACFAEPPRGYTPLTQCYQRVLDEKLASAEASVLVVLATDGEPNAMDPNGTWRRDSQRFRQLLQTRGGYRPAKCPTAIMACTDSEAEVGWLNELDDSIQNLDVIDDYRSEREEVLRVQGRRFPFTAGDYVVKTLLGAIDPLYDNLDEKKLSRTQLAEYTGRPISELAEIGEGGEGSCCVVS